MNVKTYQVLKTCEELENTISLRDYEILKNLKKGDIIQSQDLIQYSRGPTDTTKQKYVQDAIRNAEKLGLVKVPFKCSMKEFWNYETVQYWADQLSQTKVKNIEKQTNSGTQYSYLNNACAFHNWLIDREFIFKNTIQTGVSSFDVRETKVRLEGLEHFLKLYQNSYNSEIYFKKLIKTYLMDSTHSGKKASVINIARCAIMSYFKKNDSPLEIEFNSETKYDVSPKEEALLTLEEIFKTLTLGKPSIMEKALILCKFHRGLDNTTFADKFNFEAWGQLVEYFGTGEYERWDIKKCPVPIKLTRVKTGFPHVGYLDI